MCDGCIAMNRDFWLLNTHCFKVIFSTSTTISPLNEHELPADMALIATTHGSTARRASGGACESEKSDHIALLFP
ncbi:protein of unknown function (plasmid) [Paraburkholderia dioscoreae]|uniref:Uncharacterized protein n=1 Tax=Paraburkholderia dioscoreae TaxID=2604047 RepID=A0A5Q4YWP1_9BURK|nr:protein of unknown function [Paraburkholderia dioscoreae]